jgi:hypothetical protein
MEKQRDGLRERHTKRHDRGENERDRQREMCRQEDEEADTSIGREMVRVKEKEKW